MRKIKDLKPKLTATLAFIIYLGIRWFSGVQCPFLWITTLPCPCCGMTRAYLSLLRLDFAAAFDYHMMFWAVPLLYLYILYDGRLFKNKKADISVWALLGIGFTINWLSHLFQFRDAGQQKPVIISHADHAFQFRGVGQQKPVIISRANCTFYVSHRFAYVILSEARQRLAQPKDIPFNINTYHTKNRLIGGFSNTSE